MASDPQTLRRLFAAWKPFWNVTKLVLVEKSPSNIIKTRFFDKVFTKDRTQFIMLVRHPLAAVSYQLKDDDPKGDIKGKNCFASHIKHWATMYRLFLDDLAVLGPGCVMLIQYEHLLGHGLDKENGIARMQVCD
jgi:hypothetical protein